MLQIVWKHEKSSLQTRTTALDSERWRAEPHTCTGFITLGAEEVFSAGSSVEQSVIPSLECKGNIFHQGLILRWLKFCSTTAYRHIDSILFLTISLKKRNVCSCYLSACSIFLANQSCGACCGQVKSLAFWAVEALSLIP